MSRANFARNLSRNDVALQLIWRVRNIPWLASFLLKATDPRKPAKRKAGDDFEISADGKLIIPDEEGEEERDEPGSKRKRKPGTR